MLVPPGQGTGGLGSPEGSETPGVGWGATAATAKRSRNFSLSFLAGVWSRRSQEGLSLLFFIFPQKDPGKQGNINTLVSQHSVLTCNKAFQSGFEIVRIDSCLIYSRRV